MLQFIPSFLAFLFFINGVIAKLMAKNILSGLEFVFLIPVFTALISLFIYISICFSRNKRPTLVESFIVVSLSIGAYVFLSNVIMPVITPIISAAMSLSGMLNPSSSGPGSGNLGGGEDPDDNDRKRRSPAPSPSPTLTEDYDRVQFANDLQTRAEAFASQNLGTASRNIQVRLADINITRGDTEFRRLEQLLPRNTTWGDLLRRQGADFIIYSNSTNRPVHGYIGDSRIAQIRGR